MPTIRIRRGTAVQASENNVVLEAGEPGYDLTNHVLKIGDGVTPWNVLQSISAGGGLTTISYDTDGAPYLVTGGTVPDPDPDPDPDPPGDWPTALTTGTSGTLTPSGSTTLNADGATYDSIHFTDPGYINIYGDNMTFTNCKFDGIVIFSASEGTQALDCEFTKGWNVSSASNLNIERAKVHNYSPSDGIHHTSDGASMNTNNTIRDCFIVNALAEGDAHADGIQMRGSVGLHLVHNVFDMGPWRDQHNAAIYIEGANGGDTGFLIEDNLFKGGGYTCYLSQGEGVFQNNTIYPGIFGYIYAAASPGITGTGNVDENGNPIDIHAP